MYVADHLTLDEWRDRADAERDKRLFLRLRAVCLAAVGSTAPEVAAERALCRTGTYGLASSGRISRVRPAENERHRGRAGILRHWVGHAVAIGAIRPGRLSSGSGFARRLTRVIASSSSEPAGKPRAWIIADV